MKFFISIILFTAIFSSTKANNAALIKELDAAIAQRDIYTENKMHDISELKRALAFSQQIKNQEMIFKYYVELAYEYQSFVYDSAYHYIEQAKQQAKRNADEVLVNYAKTRQGFILLSGGLFKEAIDTLYSMSVDNMPDSIKCEYYSVTARSYYDLADFVQGTTFYNRYINQGNSYLDSALQYAEINTNTYWAIESLRRMKHSDWRGARHAFEYWMQNNDLPRHHYGIATSSLGYIFSKTEHINQATKYLTMAAIADIKTATKETVALRNLASILYEQGEKKKAYEYIIIALEEATYFNARHRKIELATILPIIEGERLEIIEKQRNTFGWLSGTLAILALLVFSFLLIILRQLKKITQVKIVLQKTNNSLSEMNKNLVEANIIKEEYIGYFFTLNSEYIEKLDALHKSLSRKIISRQYDDVLSVIKHTDLKLEREKLYQYFDEVFLKLFPNFVEAFNQLFAQGDQILIKKGDLLTPELRIFALMRIGIKDNEKLAKFLNYSVNTIYTYKTKVKSKSLFRESFEDRVMAIKAR
jgi:hypothetical protein